MSRFKPTLLLLLDGWGAGSPGPHNALTLAKTPVLDDLQERYPRCELECSGTAVGLPEGQMGNSEVGHLNIGAGRVVYQDIVRIDMSIEDKSLFSNRELNELFEKVKNSGGCLHLMGLVSDGGVHSHQRHLYALLEMAKSMKLSRVAVHCFLDGRDTPPSSGLGYVQELVQEMQRLNIGLVATISGRYWAMDRDKRWERVAEAYRAIVHGQGRTAQAPLKAIEAAYAAGETDEFVKPTVMVDGSDRPMAPIKDGDSIFFFNFRADRARELVSSLWLNDFDHFQRKSVPKLAGMATMTRYDADLPIPAAFPPQQLENILAEVLAAQGMQQLRIAETEKYAHVTYFFNGGVEEPYPGEERVLIPSPKEVATYDLKPEMSVYEVTDRLCAALAEGTYDLVVSNFANLDMVGHTGVIEAAVEACEAVDECVGRVVEAALAAGGRVLLSADHGNADTMLDASGNVMTAHSMSPVPFVWVEQGSEKGRLRDSGVLGDIAPTMLDLWGLDKPAEMTGESLIEPKGRAL